METIAVAKVEARREWTFILTFPAKRRITSTLLYNAALQVRKINVLNLQEHTMFWWQVAVNIAICKGDDVI